MRSSHTATQSSSPCDGRAPVHAEAHVRRRQRGGVVGAVARHSNHLGRATGRQERDVLQLKYGSNRSVCKCGLHVLHPLAANGPRHAIRTCRTLFYALWTRARLKPPLSKPGPPSSRVPSWHCCGGPSCCAHLAHAPLAAQLPQRRDQRVLVAGGAARQHAQAGPQRLGGGQARGGEQMAGSTCVTLQLTRLPPAGRTPAPMVFSKGAPCRIQAPKQQNAI